ncbi:MAG TPA: hypothetical protein VFC98_05820 [Clostridia bacterium]|nr:hypothetical protein [Clostridia bacterium]
MAKNGIAKGERINKGGRDKGGRGDKGGRTQFVTFFVAMPVTKGDGLTKGG